MKKYVKPETTENRLVFEANLAIVFDPNDSTTMQLGKERNDEEFNPDKQSESEWTNGLW